MAFLLWSNEENKQKEAISGCHTQIMHSDLLEVIISGPGKAHLKAAGSG